MTTAAATIKRPARTGPDRVAVIMFSLAAFFCVLALLAHQLQASTPRATKRPRVIVVRRVYQTTVVTTLIGSGSGSGTSVSQSVSSSGSGYVPTPAAPTTRASG